MWNKNKARADVQRFAGKTSLIRHLLAQPTHERWAVLINEFGQIGLDQALLTTAVGLCVAIPVVALLNWLERRVDHQAHEMDNLVTQVFTEDYRNGVSSSGCKTPPQARGFSSST